MTQWENEIYLYNLSLSKMCFLKYRGSQVNVVSHPVRNVPDTCPSPGFMFMVIEHCSNCSRLLFRLCIQVRVGDCMYSCIYVVAHMQYVSYIFNSISKYWLFKVSHLSMLSGCLHVPCVLLVVYQLCNSIFYNGLLQQLYLFYDWE